MGCAMRLMSLDRRQVLVLDPEAGWAWRQERAAGVAWTSIDQGRWAPEGDGVLALFEHRGAPTLLVDREAFRLDDPGLAAEVEELAPRRRRFRLSAGARVLREREYEVPVAPPRDEDDPREPATDEDLDFAVFLAARLACPGFRKSFRGVDFGKNLLTPERLDTYLLIDEARLRGCERAGDELVLGLLRIACKHDTANAATGWSFELGRECRLRRVKFERGVAVVLRRFDLSRLLEGAEEVLAGWVPESEAARLDAWLAPVEERLEELREG